MDKTQFQTYEELVNKLLKSPSSEKHEILKIHQYLLNEDFITVIKNITNKLKYQDSQNEVFWLEVFTIMLSGFINSRKHELTEDYLNCFNQVLQAYETKILESEPDSQIFNQNLNKLNEHSGNVLRNWGKITLDFAKSNWEVYRRIALTIENRCNLALKAYQKDPSIYQLEVAIAGYEIILPVFIDADESKKAIQIQSNLGYAYSRRYYEDKAKNIETAIEYLEAALVKYEEIYKIEDYPEKRAVIQNNLGYAYRNRIYGDSSDNLETAIKYYKEALSVEISEYSVEEKAEIYISLGICHKKRIYGNKEINLRKAIKCYNRVLKICFRNEYPEKWARIQHALGKAHYDLGIVYFYSSRKTNIDYFTLALFYYFKSLEVRTRDNNPKEWARVQHSLGNAYRDKRCHDDELESNIEQAIKCYLNALTQYTIKNNPEEWAQVNKSLGNAYRKLARVTNYSKLDDAIVCHQKALQILTEVKSPAEFADVSFNLGLDYLEAKNFSRSYHSFKKAINIVELLRDEILSDSDIKQKFAETWNRLYRCMVEVCIELGKHVEAIQYAERSKTRNLVELILNRDVENLFTLNKPTQVEEIKTINKEITELQYKIKTHKPKSIDIDQLLKLRKKRFALQDEIIGIGDKFDFKIFQSLLLKSTYIFIKFYITKKKLIVFIFTSKVLKVLDFPQLDLEKLEVWGELYFKVYDDKNASLNNSDLQNHLESELHQLAQILHFDTIINHIRRLSGNYQTLILVPHQSLHLLPLHALPFSTSPEENTQTLIDYFPGGVFYIPSCQLYQLVEKRKKTEYQKLFVIQTLNEKDLGVIESIGKLFPHSSIFKNNDANISRIIYSHKNKSTIKINDKLEESDCILFFGHGKFEQEKPLNSRLELKGGNLSLKDVIAPYFQLKDGSLVTLAACETGLKQRLDIGDEYISLSYGFLLARSSNIVSSLWMIHPYATALLMMKFYDEMINQGTNIALALNKAQSWLRTSKTSEFRAWLNESNLNEIWQIELDKAFDKFEVEKGENFKPFASPYYWAAFRIIGKGE
jgi:CHAT domain-containing protein